MKHKGMLSLHGLRTGVGAGLVVIATVALSPLASARPAPDSFADIVEELLPTVVNVSTTSVATQNPLDAEEFEQFRARVKVLVEQTIPAFERKLVAADAPWVPGSVIP